MHATRPSGQAWLGTPALWVPDCPHAGRAVLALEEHLAVASYGAEPTGGGGGGGGGVDLA